MLNVQEKGEQLESGTVSEPNSWNEHICFQVPLNTICKQTENIQIVSKFYFFLHDIMLLTLTRKRYVLKLHDLENLVKQLKL